MTIEIENNIQKIREGLDDLWYERNHPRFKSMAESYLALQGFPDFSDQADQHIKKTWSETKQSIDQYLNSPEMKIRAAMRNKQEDQK